ncbi:hypothetical protein K490DRAFT_65821 [Saccharata proteae CBS 121410]|uniref:BTB domain-containing protein n=1 Tax=Saccharata proteae CBS 121410 TaxID=1314787 RepID=A0A9P4M008_9PEZI|nr:hypothetical protein K490DRAFT_65821 [Saccharata proteae CBS 121410]
MTAKDFLRAWTVKSTRADTAIPTLTVKVGDPEQPAHFTVHECLIKRQSAFFEQALTGAWKESTDRIVNLVEFSPESFAIYCYWLYSNNFWSEHFSEEPLPANIEGPHPYDREWDLLLESFALGDFLQDTMFKDMIIDEITRWLTVRPTVSFRKAVELGTLIYDHTRKPAYEIREWTFCRSPRLLPIDLMTSIDWADQSSQTERGVLESANTDFRLDYLFAYIEPSPFRSARARETFIRDTRYPCRYHEHWRMDTPCYKTREPRF